MHFYAAFSWFCRFDYLLVRVFLEVRQADLATRHRMYFEEHATGFQRVCFGLGLRRLFTMIDSFDAV